MNNREKSKQEQRRHPLNHHLPYELYAFATVRYYAELQALGLLDIVGLIMYIEGLSEMEAMARCLGLLHETNEERFKFVQQSLELLQQGPDFNINHNRNN